MRLVICGLTLALGLGLCAPAAFADPIETITFSGIAGANSYQQTSIFGPSGYLSGDAFTVTVAYDPAQLTNNNPTCGTNCEFTFLPNSNESESVTIGSTTETYTSAVGGNSNDYVKFSVTGNATNGYIDTISLNIAGNQMTAVLPDGSTPPLFSSETNLNNAYLLNNVTSETLTNATFSTNINNSDPYLYNSTGTPLRLTTSDVPEPASLGLLAVGVLGLGVILRHWASRRQLSAGFQLGGQLAG